VFLEVDFCPTSLFKLTLSFSPRLQGAVMHLLSTLQLPSSISFSTHVQIGRLENKHCIFFILKTLRKWHLKMKLLPYSDTTECCVTALEEYISNYRTSMAVSD